MKYAELPNGVVLKFPDDASEKSIQRAVRRELGQQGEDILEMFEALAAKVEALVDGQQGFVRSVSGAVDAGVKRHGEQLSNATQDMRETLDAFSAKLLKTTQSHLALVSKLIVAMDSLNRTLDAAMGQSLGALDNSLVMTQTASESMERALNGMNALVHRLAATMEAMVELRHTRRRAYKNRDGSYEFETITS